MSEEYYMISTKEALAIRAISAGASELRSKGCISHEQQQTIESLSKNLGLNLKANGINIYDFQ